jgi:hypothetical protein
VGDVDGDGNLDIVTGNHGGQNVVYVNQDGGNFYTGSDCSAHYVRCFGTGSDYTWSVAVGDVVEEGWLDLVTGNDGGQNVVYVNQDGGYFYTGSDCSAPNVRCFGTGSDNTSSVAVGDVDGDGQQDLVTGNVNQQNVVYLNDGAGHFPLAAGWDFGTGSDQTWSVAVGDVDGDGHQDLVTGNVNQNVVYLNPGFRLIW